MAWPRTGIVVFAFGSIAACAGAGTRAPARWDTQKVALKIGGANPDPEPQQKQAPAAPTPARLPAPVGAPRYALGFDKPVDGCLKGQVYALPAKQKALGDDYAEAPPSGALWGCEWNLNGQKLSDAIPGATPERAYAVRYQGTFEVASSGAFKFGLVSSGDTRIVVDGAALIGGSSAPVGAANSAGSTGSKTSTPSAQAANPSAEQQAVYLGAGRHQILIEYLAAGDALSFQLAVTLPGATQAAPFSMRPAGPFYAQQGLDYTGPAGSTGDDWRKLVDVGAGQLKLNGRVYFRSASAELDQMDKTENALLALAKTLKERENVACVEIDGHTDNRGDASANLKLSRDRAEAVRQWLIQAGIEPHRLTAVGFGGERPLAGNETDDGRASNRRVEFEVRTPDSSGACPRDVAKSSASHVRLERQVAPEIAERACGQSAALRSKLLGQLEPWLKDHRACSADADCTRAIPLECPNKSRGLDCAWVVVNQSSVDALHVNSVHLDSLGNYCKELPEDAEVRSCGGCGAQSFRCASGVCQLGAR